MKRTGDFELNNGTEVDFRELIQKYVRHWYVFLISLLLCVGLAYAYIQFATPHYRVTSTLLLKDDDSEFGGNSGPNSAPGEIAFFSFKHRIDNEIEVLRANSLMQRVFQELGLNATYYRSGKLRLVEIYGSELPLRLSITKLHPSAYQQHIQVRRKTSTTYELTDESGDVSTHKYGEEISKPYGIFTVIAAADNKTPEPIHIVFHDIKKEAYEYNNRIKIEALSRKSSVIKITLIDSVPQKAKDIINKLIDVYRKEATEDRNLLATTTIQFIDERLKFLKSDLSSVERGVETLKQQHEVTNVNANADSYVAQASENNRQLSDLAIQIDVLESIENYVDKGPGQLEVIPSNLSIQDPTLTQLVTKFNELQLEKERMLRTALPGNPLVQDLNDQLASLQLNILENLHNIKNGLLIAQKRLQATSGKYRSQIQMVPSIERELLEISRQQGTKDNLYQYLLQKREEAALGLEATVDRTRLLDPATETDEPISPKKLLIYFLAIIAGLGIPLSGIYMTEVLNDKIQSKRDIQAATRTPILGEISHNSSGKALIVTEQNSTSISELFRLIRSNLQFATAGKENKVMMITSSQSGEGKTFFSINLAASLALIGKRVVLLELDLRAPSMSRQLGKAPGLGVSDYLAGGSKKISLEDVVRPLSAVPGFYVVSSGSLPPNPAELMTSPNLANMIHALKASFDFIIIDTAPVGKVADSFSLASLVDSTIFLTRFNYTQKAQLELIDDIYENKKLPHPMIVLNDSKEEHSQTYGYGYNYGSKKKNKKERSEINIS